MLLPYCASVVKLHGSNSFNSYVYKNDIKHNKYLKPNSTYNIQLIVSSKSKHQVKKCFVSEGLKVCIYVWILWVWSQSSSSPFWYFNWYPIRMPLGSRGLSHSRWMVSKLLRFIVKNLGASGTTTHKQISREKKQEGGAQDRRKKPILPKLGHYNYNYGLKFYL